MRFFQQRALFLFMYLCIQNSVFPLFVFSQEKSRDAYSSITEILSFVSEEDKTIILSGESVSAIDKKPAVRLQNRHQRLRYVPRGETFEKVRTFVVEHNPSIVYEKLFFIKTNNDAERERVLLIISNYFRDVSVLATIKYQNIKKGYIYPVFLSSQQVKGIDDYSPYSTLTPLRLMKKSDESVFVLQDMPPFGNVVSRYTYTLDTMFTFLGNNLTDVSYRGISAVSPQNMITASYVVPVAEGVLVYGMGAVKISGIAVLFKGIISNSFESRMVGLFNWIKNEYEGKEQLK